MTHKPTEEQQAIIDRAVSTSDPMLVDALPGSAKSTTIEMVIRAMPVKPILNLAFNKPIVVALDKRLSDMGHVKNSTINSLGHRAWGGTVGKRLTLTADKNAKILKQLIDDLPRSQRSEAWDLFGDLRKGVSRAKLSGYIPDKVMMHVPRVVKTPDWLEDEGEFNGFGWLIDEVLKESIKQAYAGNIDFDDQIYMPTLFGGTFPRFPEVMLDEAQDMSRLNHLMLKKLVLPGTRLMAVGDDRQSIYAFRGAMPGGMDLLEEQYGLQRMRLSISFRCPRAVIRNARWRAPHMMWPDWAIDGQVVALDEWGIGHIPDGAAIICRNNAPLFKTALDLLKAGRGVQLLGFDIGPGLVRVFKKLGPETMTQGEVLLAIDKWEAAALHKAGAGKEGNIVDRADCLRVFARNGDNLASAIAYAEGLFKLQGPIQLCSGHKAKGLEWDTVFHLDPWRVPSKFAQTEEEKIQEDNIKFVIETRPKASLFMATAEGFC